MKDTIIFKSKTRYLVWKLGVTFLRKVSQSTIETQGHQIKTQWSTGRWGLNMDETDEYCYGLEIKIWNWRFMDGKRVIFPKVNINILKLTFWFSDMDYISIWGN